MNKRRKIEETKNKMNIKNNLNFRDEAELVKAICEFFKQNLAQGKPAIVFATEDHRSKLETALAENGLDIEAMIEFGQIVILDAKETLSYFSTPEGTLNPTLFLQVVGGVIAQTSHLYGDLHIYEEMTDVLQEHNQQTNASTLNRLWNELGQHRKFKLFNLENQTVKHLPVASSEIRLLTSPRFA